MRRKRIAEQYFEQLISIPDLVLPYVPEWADPIWHVYVVRHPRRDALQEHLRRCEIGTLIHYPVPPHLSDAYHDLGMQKGDFPITEEMANTVLSIPMGPHISVEDVKVVNDALAFFL